MNYKKMGPNTKVYYLITSGNDGSYIVDGFVSRHELPEMEKWPYTYATIGHVLKSAKVAIPTDNYIGKCAFLNTWTLKLSSLPLLNFIGDAKVHMLAQDLVYKWICVLKDFEMPSCEDDTFDEPLKIFEEKDDILAHNMKLAQYLNSKFRKSK